MKLLAYATRRAIAGMGERPLLAGATVITVATSLLLIGAFALVLLNLSGVLDRWGKDVQISCYLADDVPDDRVFELKAELEARPEVAQARYVSSDEALALFGDSLQGLDRLLSDLDENPLPASLEVRLHPQHQQPEQVEAIARALRRPEFAEMDWSQEWVERFHAFLGLLRLSALVLGLLLLAAAVVLVSTTIRMAIYARREELEIVALVGGTRLFARLPFLIEGSLQGLFGSLVALALLGTLHRLAFVELQDVLGLLLGGGLLRFLPTPWMLALVASGLAVGALGAGAALLRDGEPS